MFHSHGNEQAEYYVAKFLIRTTLLTGTGASFYLSTSAFPYQCHSTTATYSFIQQLCYRITRIDSVVKQDITVFYTEEKGKIVLIVRHKDIWSLKLWPFYSTETSLASAENSHSWRKDN
jgi:hypothetical protein